MVLFDREDIKIETVNEERKFISFFSDFLDFDL